MRPIYSLQTLDQELSYAEAARSRSESEFIARLADFYLVIEPAEYGFDQPSDSAAFRAGQLKLYEQIALRPYSLENEETPFDLEAALRIQHPYISRDAQMVSDFLMSYAHLIRVANLPAGARILEVGSGYGSLTVHLAAMGYEVTCLDISQSFLTYVQRRCQQHFAEIKTICGDMVDVAIEGQFEAVIFYESFHHASQHQLMLKRIPSLLTPQGIVVFGAEPIVGNDSPLVPYDWGIRLDGLSLWSIRRFGWLEMGFREGYFRSLLTGMGWQPERFNVAGIPHSDVWIARAANAVVESMPPENNTVTSTDNLNAELHRLQNLVRAYENGRFIKFMKWLKGGRHR